MRANLLTFVGVCFVLIGGFTVFGATAGIAVAHTIRWANLGYAGMDLLIAYGALTRQRWLLWAFTLNWAAYLAIFIIQGMRLNYPLILWVGLSLDTVLLLIAWYGRELLRQNNRTPAVAFFVLWVATMGYTIYSLL